MADEVMAYCVKEKAQKPMKDAHEVELKNGKHALQGVCSSCGTKMTKFISAKKSSAQPQPSGRSGVENMSSAPQGDHNPPNEPPRSM